LFIKRFHHDEIPFDFQHRYNIVPVQMVPTIIGDSGKRRIGQLRWGLVPFLAQLPPTIPMCRRLMMPPMISPVLYISETKSLDIPDEGGVLLACKKPVNQKT
jgi:hypothetical protein